MFAYFYNKKTSVEGTIISGYNLNVYDLEYLKSQNPDADYVLSDKASDAPENPMPGKDYLAYVDLTHPEQPTLAFHEFDRPLTVEEQLAALQAESTELKAENIALKAEQEQQNAQIAYIGMMTEVV